VTSAMLGAFRNSSRTRLEFLELINQRGAIRGGTMPVTNFHPVEE
jgi:hypothetical protein